MAPTAIKEIRGGAWSSAVALDTKRGPMIMRFSETGDDFGSDQLASQYAGPDLPIPAVYGIGQIGDRWWCISQRMPGGHLDELNAEELEVALPSVAAMLRALRSVTSENTSGYGGWDANGNGRFKSFADQLLDVAIDVPGDRGGGWSVRLRLHPRAQSVFEAGISKLESLIPYVPSVRQLIHQDTINYNVTMAGNQISGIFDWGCAMWGDALYDLAWFRFWYPWYPQWASLDLPSTLEEMVGVEGEHHSERMACYLVHIAIGHIRYNAFTENWKAMNEVVDATQSLLRDLS